MNNHYIEYLFPGSFLSESAAKPVLEPVFDGAWPDRAFAYRFFVRAEMECDGEVLRGTARDHTGWTYRGRVLTLNDIPDTQENRILRSNMQINGWSRVVRTVFGRCFPLDEDDTVQDTNHE